MFYDLYAGSFASERHRYRHASVRCGRHGCAISLDRARVRQPVQPVGAFDRPADAEVADREHVGALQVEHQEHVRGPHAQPLDGHELGDHRVVVELVQALELQLARERVLGERSEVADLRARQSRGGAQLFGLVLEDLLGVGGRPSKRAVSRP